MFSETVALAQARQIKGLQALFGEVYPDPVRVVSIGVDVNDLLNNTESDSLLAHSIELCGGTHLNNTIDARAFVIIEETAVAKGIRRIEALTGDVALGAIQEGECMFPKLP